MAMTTRIYLNPNRVEEGEHKSGFYLQIYFQQGFKLKEGFGPVDEEGGDAGEGEGDKAEDATTTGPGKFVANRRGIFSNEFCESSPVPDWSCPDWSCPVGLGCELGLWIVSSFAPSSLFVSCPQSTRRARLHNTVHKLTLVAGGVAN